MAWIESHQSLSKHKKTLRTAGRLSVDRHTLIGHLMELWWWAVDNVDCEGYLGDVTDNEIAMAAEWTGDAGEFVSALIEAGFIDVENEEKYLHDWYDYAGKLIERREKERQRSRKRRNNSQRTVQRSTAQRPSDNRQTTDGTVHNSTVHKSTQPTTTPKPPPSATAEDEVAVTAEEPQDDVVVAEKFWEQKTAMLPNKTQSEILDDYRESGMEEPVIIHAMVLTLKKGAGFDYLDGILKRYRAGGIKSLDAAKRDTAQFEQRKRDGPRQVLVGAHVPSGMPQGMEVTVDEFDFVLEE